MPLPQRRRPNTWVKLSGRCPKDKEDGHKDKDSSRWVGGPTLWEVSEICRPISSSLAGPGSTSRPSHPRGALVWGKQLCLEHRPLTRTHLVWELTRTPSRLLRWRVSASARFTGAETPLLSVTPTLGGTSRGGSSGARASVPCSPGTHAKPSQTHPGPSPAAFRSSVLSGPRT